MRYCSRCVLPETRPNLTIGDDGVCNACKGHQEKDDTIDWEERKQQFEQLVAEVKALKRPFDCIVPVSGGKDSVYQVIKCLEYGLRVLAVTWRSPGRTELGQKNLDNVIALGVDHIDYTVNPELERRFTLASLQDTGSAAVPMHFGIYMIPLRLAVSMSIPLVVWGESPAMEYGGTQTDRQKNQLDHHFLRTHGILQGTLIEDWIDRGVTDREAEIYRVPSEEDFARVGLRSVYVGYYFRWSPQESLRVALENGFQVREEGPKVGYYNYADIDCDLISIHHYFKWFKFGFTRLFDNLSIEIRNGQMTRDEAIEIIREHREQTPQEDIRWLCSFLRISESEFWEIAERYRNTHIWKNEGGVWKIPGFLIEDFEW